MEPLTLLGSSASQCVDAAARLFAADRTNRRHRQVCARSVVDPGGLVHFPCHHPPNHFSNHSFSSSFYLFYILFSLPSFVPSSSFVILQTQHALLVLPRATIECGSADDFAVCCSATHHGRAAARSRAPSSGTSPRYRATCPTRLSSSGIPRHSPRGLPPSRMASSRACCLSPTFPMATPVTGRQRPTCPRPLSDWRIFHR
ncbi:hypothetical protein VTG60DRAFT_6852 [Thermothelomyces hinnuleus]